MKRSKNKECREVNWKVREMRRRETKKNINECKNKGEKKDGGGGGRYKE